MHKIVLFMLYLNFTYLAMVGESEIQLEITELILILDKIILNMESHEATIRESRSFKNIIAKSNIAKCKIYLSKLYEINHPENIENFIMKDKDNYIQKTVNFIDKYAERLQFYLIYADAVYKPGGLKSLNYYITACQTLNSPK